jgi:hypothetical protein
MTQQLSDFFNLEPAKEEPVKEEAENVTKAETFDIVSTAREELSIAERINEALPQVKGLESEDKELDEYAQKAMDSFDRLMDLGFNVDDRNAGVIFDVASKMMSNALAAKTTKLDKKLKMIKLQLDAAKLANTMSKKEEKEEDDSELTTDRNAILNLINQNLKNKDK